MNEVPDLPTATATDGGVGGGGGGAVFSEFIYEVEVMTVWHGFCVTIVVIVVVTTAPGRTDVAMPICELLLLFCTETEHGTWTFLFCNFFLN